jgi:hypothetical protein
MSDLKEFTKRDYQAGTVMAWHKLTRFPMPDGVLGMPGVMPAKMGVLTADNTFPEMIRSNLYFRDEREGKENALVKFGDMQCAVSVDDGLPCGVPFNDGYTLFSPRDAWKWTHEALAGTDFSVVSAALLWNRSKWAVTFELAELTKATMKGHNILLACMGGLDKTLSPSWKFVAQCIVCANTWNLALMADNVFEAGKLTKNYLTRLNSDEKKAEFDKIAGVAAVFNATMENLKNDTCKIDEAREVFAGDIARNGGNLAAKRSSNTLDDLTSLFANGGGIDNSAPETRSAVVAAYTQLFTRGPEGLRKSDKNPFQVYQTGTYGDWANRKEAFFSDVTREAVKAQKADKSAGVPAIAARQAGWTELREIGRKALADAATVTVQGADLASAN